LAGKSRPWRASLADLAASGGRATKMIFVYVIVGKNNFRYVGITKDLKDRLERHNSSRNLSTKNRGPFSLLIKEGYKDYREARTREKFLKSGVGRKFLDNLVF